MKLSHFTRTIFILDLDLGYIDKILGIPVGTNCAPLVADLLLFCYERDFMLSLSNDNKYEVIEAFDSTSRCLDDLLNIDNTFFDSMVNHIYPLQLRLNTTDVSDTEALVWIYIYLYRIVLLRLNFLINAVTLILILIV